MFSRPFQPNPQHHDDPRGPRDAVAASQALYRPRLPAPEPAIYDVMLTRDEIYEIATGRFLCTVNLQAIKTLMLRTWRLFEDSEVQYRVDGIRVLPTTSALLEDVASPTTPPLPINDTERVPLDQHGTLALARQTLLVPGHSGRSPYSMPPGVHLWLTLVRVRLMRVRIGPSEEEMLLGDPSELIIRRMRIEQVLHQAQHQSPARHPWQRH